MSKYNSKRKDSYEIQVVYSEGYTDKPSSNEYGSCVGQDDEGQGGNDMEGYDSKDWIICGEQGKYELFFSKALCANLGLMLFGMQIKLDKHKS